MPKIQSKEDYIRQLENEMMALKESIEWYKRWMLWWYQSISRTLRKLFHSKGRNPSLINRLNIEDRIFMLSTNQNTVWAFHSNTFRSSMNGVLFLHDNSVQAGLVYKDHSNDWIFYFPRYFNNEFHGKVENWVSFDQWWNDEIIIWSKEVKNIGSDWYTRSDLIINFADKVWVHNDDKIPDVLDLIQNKSFQNYVVNWKKVEFGNSLLEASVMQIAYEALKSLENAKM